MKNFSELHILVIEIFLDPGNYQSLSDPKIGRRYSQVRQPIRYPKSFFQILYPRIVIPYILEFEQIEFGSGR